MTSFDPANWFWIVGGDESRAWSSAASGYVQAWPGDKVTRIASEEELTDVVGQYGIQGPLTRATDVDAERDRRIFAGFTFGGVRFQSRIEDQKRIAGAGTLALAALVSGKQAGDLRWSGSDADFVWIAEDNSLVPMDAPTMLAFGQAAAAHESAHVFAARALKAVSPIPADYTADDYWPD